MARRNPINFKFPQGFSSGFLYHKPYIISMLLSETLESSAHEELIKTIRNECIIKILFKQNKAYCHCRIKACFHAGQMDFALRILRLTGFDIEKVRHMLMNQPLSDQSQLINKGEP